MTIGTKIAKNNSNVDTANNTVIGMTQYKDLLAWAEKVSNGQLDAAGQIKTHCATWLNADIDKNTVIDIIKADDLNGFRNFLAQFNFTVKDDAGYIHKLHTCDNGDCVLAESGESATTNTEVKEPDDEDREKFLRAKEEIKTTAGRYLGDGKFAQIWQRNNGFGWRNIAKKNAALILAEYGLTVDEYLAAQKQWIDEEVARGAAQCAIYYQAQFLRDKIRRDRKASNEPMPALFPAEDADDDDELIDEPEVDKSATADSLTRAMKIALEHYQDFCRVGNLTVATNELSLYNICRKAMTELWKEEAA